VRTAAVAIRRTGVSRIATIARAALALADAAGPGERVANCEPSLRCEVRAAAN
jgi:hypothetical protein